MFKGAGRGRLDRCNYMSVTDSSSLRRAVNVLHACRLERSASMQRTNVKENSAAAIVGRASLGLFSSGSHSAERSVNLGKHRSPSSSGSNRKSTEALRARWLKGRFESSETGSRLGFRV